MTQTLTESLGVKPGDIFYNSWGYDQTNIDYYLVTRVTASKAEVVPIGSRSLATESFHSKVVPNPDYVREYDVILRVERSDVKKSKLCTVRSGYKGRATIVLRSGEHWAYPWEGDALYETDPHLGH